MYVLHTLQAKFTNTIRILHFAMYLNQTQARRISTLPPHLISMILDQYFTAGNTITLPFLKLMIGEGWPVFKLDIQDQKINSSWFKVINQARSLNSLKLRFCQIESVLTLENLKCLTHLAFIKCTGVDSRMLCQLCGSLPALISLQLSCMGDVKGKLDRINLPSLTSLKVSATRLNITQLLRACQASLNNITFEETDYFVEALLSDPIILPNVKTLALYGYKSDVRFICALTSWFPSLTHVFMPGINLCSVDPFAVSTLLMAFEQLRKKGIHVDVDSLLNN